MKKQLKESDEDKKLIAANIYFNLYMDTLEEVVKDNGDIYLRESGDRYAKVSIKKKSFKCWVEYSFWTEFSELFSLEYREAQSFITRWIEDTYRLKGIDTPFPLQMFESPLKVPTN